MSTLLEIRNLTKSYGKGPVLQNVSLNVDSGRIVGDRPKRLRKNHPVQDNCRAYLRLSGNGDVDGSPPG